MTRFAASALAAPILLALAAIAQSQSTPSFRVATEGGLAPDDVITIDGHVGGRANAALVIRVDDATSRDYASRANLERSLPPGPFHWQVGAQGLRTSAGRPLDLKTVRDVRLFAASPATVSITKMEIGKAPALTEKALAFSFGEADAPLLPGFKRILPDDPMITAGKPRAIRRPGPDPLIASGIAGAETIKIAWPMGKARVTLWTEDPADWELLPHPLQRRIRVNGADVLYELYKPEDWLRNRYLRGLRYEHSKTDDAWTAYGRHRGGLISVETIAAATDTITIELAGDSPSATFINAVIVEPAGQAAARTEAEARRAAWYRGMWPVQVDGAEAAPPSTVLKGTAARGTGVLLNAILNSAAPIEHPAITVEPPIMQGTTLDVRVWAAQRRLERRGAGDTVLRFDDNTLRPDLSALPLLPGEPRTYRMWVSIPRDAPPGLYRGTMTLAGTNGQRVPIEIEVLDVTLPDASKAAGFYMAEAPQWSWFYGFESRRKEQLACDLHILGSFGITGNAPAMAMPLGDGVDTFIGDAMAALAAQTAAPWLAYTPAKELFARVGAAESAALMRQAVDRLKAVGLPPPVWSMADEPSNAESRGFNLKGWIATIRQGGSAVKLGAQLNSPKDLALAPLFDVAIVNQGFGIDLPGLTALKMSGTDVWLYNTGKPRATAGLWLWLTPASRYIQWHARMPTADPFDPIDGREGDVQMIFPSVEACPARPVIHTDLLRMAEGLVDQRWLLWLDNQPGSEAAALAHSLRARAGARFDQVALLDEADLDGIRASIMDLARKTKLSSR